MIKSLIEALAGSWTGAVQLREERRRREVAAELFLLYTHINQILVTAEDIVRAFEGLAGYASGGPDAFARVPPSQEAVRQLVLHQGDQLRRASELLDENSVLLQIIEPRAYNRLVPLIGFKSGALAAVGTVMSGGGFPTRPTQAEVDAWAVDLARRTGSRGRIATDMVLAAGDDVVDASEGEWFRSGERAGTAPTADFARWFLRAREPREQLAGIREAVETLRAALLENFTVADVLLQVGERQRRRTRES